MYFWAKSLTSEVVEHYEDWETLNPDLGPYWKDHYEHGKKRLPEHISDARTKGKCIYNKNGLKITLCKGDTYLFEIPCEQKNIDGTAAIIISWIWLVPTTRIMYLLDLFLKKTERTITPEIRDLVEMMHEALLGIPTANRFSLAEKIAWVEGVIIAICVTYLVVSWLFW